MFFWGGDGGRFGHSASGQQEAATVQDRPLDGLAFGEVQGVGDGRREVHIPLLGAPALDQLDCCRIWHTGNISMLNHRHKRILFPMLFVKEMIFICPEAPSGCQNPGDFPKGIMVKVVIKAHNSSTSTAPLVSFHPSVSRPHPYIQFRNDAMLSRSLALAPFGSTSVMASLPTGIESSFASIASASGCQFMSWSHSMTQDGRTRN